MTENMQKMKRKIIEILLRLKILKIVNEVK